jgi:hypothetical protein
LIKIKNAMGILINNIFQSPIPVMYTVVVECMLTDKSNPVFLHGKISTE